MTSVLPAWCRPPDPFVGRDAVVDAAVDLLREGPVTLVGGPGVGTTTAAGAVLAALVERGRVDRVVAIRIHACTTLPDVIWAVGQGLGLALGGDQPGVERALRASRVAVLLDDADLNPALAIEAESLGRGTLWLATARQVADGRQVDVPPLSPEDMARLLPPESDVTPYAGRPALVAMPRPIHADDPWGLDALPPGAEVLAELPMGLPEGTLTAPAHLLLDVPGRMVLRRSVREALGGDPEPGAPLLTATLRDRLAQLHALATDAEALVDRDDLVLFRVAAERVADPDLAALAAAASARLSLYDFQAAEALDRVRPLLARQLPGATRGLLRWVEGDALLAQGLDEDADLAYQDASRALREAWRGDALAALARRCAEHEVARGRASRAREWLGIARTALGARPDRAALADVTRISGDLAAAAGELVGAEALYDEADAALRDVPGDAERAVLALGRAAVATARGQHTAASNELARAESLAGSVTRIRAAVAVRRADLSMRRGGIEESRAHVAAARAAYATIGSVRGLVACTRTTGDLLAVAGDRAGAASAYREAIDLCVRTRDVEGVARLLARLLAIEREGEPGEHVAELEESLEIVEVLRSSQVG